QRSLERRGRPRRSSVELYRMRPARDLTLGDVLERSAHYSELRRRAAQRSAMPGPSVAIGGISALALVAGSTLPTLLLAEPQRRSASRTPRRRTPRRGPRPPSAEGGATVRQSTPRQRHPPSATGRARQLARPQVARPRAARPSPTPSRDR